MTKIREYAPKIQKAEYDVHRTEADVKKISAQLKMKAMAEGIKTTSGQETWAENEEELYLARLEVGLAKGHLQALKVELKALEVGFEEWRTQMVNEREEMKRYGM